MMHEKTTTPIIRPNTIIHVIQRLKELAAMLEGDAGRGEAIFDANQENPDTRQDIRNNVLRILWCAWPSPAPMQHIATMLRNQRAYEEFIRSGEGDTYEWPSSPTEPVPDDHPIRAEILDALEWLQGSGYADCFPAADPANQEWIAIAPIGEAWPR